MVNKGGFNRRHLEILPEESRYRFDATKNSDKEIKDIHELSEDQEHYVAYHMIRLEKETPQYYLDILQAYFKMGYSPEKVKQFKNEKQKIPLRLLGKNGL